MSLTDTITELVESVVRRVLDDRILGIHTATVTALTEEGVILTYRSLNVDPSNDEARVASIMAGPGVGAYFRPEVGDEVIVAFEGGDLSQPVVVGSVWNPDANPPSQADTSSSNNIRTIVSRDKHEITLDDSPGGGGITIRTSSGAEIKLQDAGKKVSITTGGSVANTQIVLDGVSWNHQHATGVGPSGPPISISPAL
ncbi:MAG: hypothetical protein ACI9VR_005068 [Cognaticolwellia sp.]|jgi:uncharacterized protein involved in type VI secretion and phage assembly